MPETLTPNFRQRTHGRDLRRDYPEKDHLEALCRRAMQARKGHIVFLAGPRLSGRSDLLQTLGEHIRQTAAGVDVCASRFAGDRFEDLAPKPDAAEAAVKTTLNVLGALTTGRAAQAIKAFNEIVKGYFDGRRALVAKESASLLRQSLDELKRRLQQAAAAGPILWLIDDFDRGDAGFTHALLYELRAELADRLPVVFVLAVEGRATLEADPARASALQSVAGSLVAGGGGDWLPVRPLGKAEVADWLGQTGPGIAESLLQVSEGFPPRVAEVWYQWQAEGFIVHDTAADTWRKANPKADLPLSAARNATHKYLRDRFPDDTPQEREQWHMVLQLCAAEGETFTADCVADAVEWDRDEMQDFLDDFFVRNDDNPDGLLLEPTFHRFADKFGEEREVCRYRFASPYTWLALERDDDPRLHRQQARLADALRTMYDETETWLAARLARIYERNGAGDAAHHFALIADRGHQIEQLAAGAFHVIAMWKAMRRQFDPYAAQRHYDLLMEAGQRMKGMYPLPETFHIFYAAARIARDFPDPLDAVRAQFHCAELLEMMSRSERARRAYSRILDHLSEIESAPVAGRRQIKQLRAVCLEGLADIASMQEDLETAADLYRQALDIARGIKARRTEAQCLEGLAEIARLQVKHETAADLYRQALDIAREIKARRTEARCLEGLALIARMQGERETAADFYRQALDIAREIKHRRTEAECLKSLAAIARMQGERETAADFYRQALDIAREIKARRTEARCLEGLAQIARIQAEYETATDLNRQALTIAGEIKDRSTQVQCLHGLMATAQMQDDRETADDFLQQSLAIVREMDVPTLVSNLAEIARVQDDRETADDFYQYMLAIARELGAPIPEGDLAEIARMQDDRETADDFYQLVQDITREIGVPELEAGIRAVMEKLARHQKGNEA